MRAAFGPQASTYHFGRYIIMTYTTNLLTDLGPGLPRAAAS